ncbi:MAG: phosphoglucosamine mutase [Desulfobacterales bacterium]|jgi:phosphoglucosamine mutase|nr:phosphoglucosamine mutase [Desulfobacterales bacterium]
MMGKLFGTDGIRGVANSYPVTAEMALAVGRALATLFKKETDAPVIVIGQDTRLSGDMLASALAAGICSAGGDALQYGVIPTPAVAYHIQAIKAHAGVVISASHNPYFDNGIKVFGPDGFKLSDAAEHELETAVLENSSLAPGTENTGRVRICSEGVQAYADFLIRTLPAGFTLAGMKIVIDCANGATFQAAPRVFEQLGAEVNALFISPDGRNINDACGSQHPEALAEAVLKTGADIGLAFDGDGDRLIAVDETGKVLTGDQILAVCATALSKKGLLKENKVVTTVMSNLGFKAAMKAYGIAHYTAQVGDRYVLEMMRETGATLGGEDSGHMIFLNHHTTGDGLLAGLRLLEVMAMKNKPLSELSRVMTVFPQVLINVDVREKPPIETVPEIQQAIEAAAAALGDKGRVLVRYSGTQPMCRVMVEGPTQAITRQYCEIIAETVRRAIGIS